MVRDRKIVVVSGPTASGKTGYSIKLAKENNGLIINADSMQIYQGLPILSAQPSENEKSDIEHLLFSYLKPNENCNIGLWLSLVKKSIEYAFKKNKTPIVIGGTGMYISKLINGISKIPEVTENTRNKIIDLYNEIGHDRFYKKALEIDEEYVKKLNANDKHRLMRLVEVFEISGKSIRHFQKEGNNLIFPTEYFYHININPPRDDLYNKCLLRFKKMAEQENVLEEIKVFSNNFPDIVKNKERYSINNTIGLNEGIQYLGGEISLNDFINKSVKITKNYAKRQYTWFNHQFDKFDLRINELL